MKWLLILSLYSGGVQLIPMESQRACTEAAKNLMAAGAPKAVCLNRATGEVIQGGRNW